MEAGVVSDVGEEDCGNQDCGKRGYYVTFKRYEYVKLPEPVMAFSEKEAVAIAMALDDEGELDYEGLKDVSDGFTHDWSNAEAEVAD